MTSLPNPFTVLLDTIQKKLAFSRTFIGISVDEKGQMTVLKDEATGKFIWYRSCASLHTEFVSRLQSDPTKYKGCDLYAVNGESYVNNKLLISLYNTTNIKVSPEVFAVFNAIELDFHKNANIGMFMPLKFNLDKLYAKIKDDPSQLFAAAIRAKDLVFNESKPCVSCGVLCHVPDLSDEPNISAAALKEILNMTEDNKNFCFECGRTIMVNMAKHKMTDCTDLQKISTVKDLVMELESCELSDLKFDFDKAQTTMKSLMSCVSKTRMTVVNNSKVTEQKLHTPVKPTNLTKPSDISPWMN
jgi:hypothetical protein